MRSALIFTVLCMLVCVGCSAVIAKDDEGSWCARWSLLNLRVGDTFCATGDVTIGHTAEEMSETASGFGTNTIAAIVKVALQCYGGAAISSAISCPTTIGGIVEKAEELVAAEEKTKTEKKRRTPEEKAANRAKREGGHQ